jgi:hypothetical protein
MYTIDERDRVVELTDLPLPESGATSAKVLATEWRLVIGYYVAPGDSNRVAFLDFDSPRDHMFGGPNDEAMRRHPLCARGLEYYSIHEIIDSSWIRARARINDLSVDPEVETIDAKLLRGKRHFIFAFHDSTFECIAGGVGDMQVFDDRNHDMLDEMVKQIRKER